MGDPFLCISVWWNSRVMVFFPEINHCWWWLLLLKGPTVHRTMVIPCIKSCVYTAKHLTKNNHTSYHFFIKNYCIQIQNIGCVLFSIMLVGRYDCFLDIRCHLLFIRCHLLSRCHLFKKSVIIRYDTAYRVIRCWHPCIPNILIPLGLSVITTVTLVTCSYLHLKHIPVPPLVHLLWIPPEDQEQHNRYYNIRSCTLESRSRQQCLRTPHL